MQNVLLPSEASCPQSLKVMVHTSAPLVRFTIIMDTYGMDLGPLLAAGETLDVEFKRRMGKDDLYQAVVCMANGTGGLILVGVDDDSTVVGATGDHGGPVDADLLAGRIQNGIEPPLSVDVARQT